MSKICSECKRSKDEYYISIGKVLCFDCWKFHRDSGENMSKYIYYDRQKANELENRESERKIEGKINAMSIGNWVESVKQHYQKKGSYSEEIRIAPSNYVEELIAQNIYREGGEKYVSNEPDYDFDDCGNITYCRDTGGRWEVETEYLNDVIKKIRPDIYIGKLN